MVSATAALATIGQLTFGGYFVLAGINQLLSRSQKVAIAADRGVPAATALVPLSSVMLLVGGGALGADPLVDLPTRYLGVPLLCAFLLVVTPAVHDFWNVPASEDGGPVTTVENAADGQRVSLPPKDVERSNFVGNLGLLGALLALL